MISIASSIRRIRELGATQKASNSCIMSPPPGAFCPMQAAKMERPLDMKSSEAHWYASNSASRSGVEAKQAGPILTRSVTTASAPISVSASRRGLARIESPTQMLSQRSSASARWASAIMSSNVDAPVTTPRFESVSPNFTTMFLRSCDRRVMIVA